MPQEDEKKPTAVKAMLPCQQETCQTANSLRIERMLNARLARRRLKAKQPALGIHTSTESSLRP